MVSHTNTHQPSLIFLDTGLTTTLSPENRKNFLDLFDAIARNDGRLAASLMVSRSKAGTCVDQPRFEQRMAALIGRVQRQTFSLGDIRISEILGETMSIVRDHQVRIEPDFTNLVVSIIVLEGLGRQLNPEVDLFRAALPVLRQELSKTKGWAVFLVWFYSEVR